MNPDIFLVIPIILLSLTLHEFGHAWTALQGGDRTAAEEGRVTLNPVSHIDPIGTLILPLVLAISGQPVFGWARPVPIAYWNLRRPIWIVWSTIAGPLANVLIALVAVLLLKIALIMGGDAAVTEFLSSQERSVGVAGALYKLAWLTISINIALAVFNMIIPIPPLDGSRVVHYFLMRNRPELDRIYTSIEPFGFIIIYLLFRLPGPRQALHSAIDLPRELVLKFLLL